MMRVITVATVVALAVGSARTVCAQSITAGELSGAVTDTLGQPLYGADVIVSDRATGVERVTTVTRGGQYRFPLLPPGEYEIFAEALGYRPRRVRGVPVRPGVAVDVPMALAWAPPPVTAVDTAYYPGGVYQSASTASGHWFPAAVLDGFPEADRSVNSILSLSSSRTGSLEGEGLPGQFSGFALDGLPFAPILHPGAPSDIGSALPRSAFGAAQQVNGGPDVEWSGLGGGALSAFSRQGTPVPTVRAFADWTGAALSSSKFFPTDAAPNTTLRGGMIVTGPIIPDTAHFVLGVEAQRIQSPLPASWTDDSLVNIARDSFATNLSSYGPPRIATTQRVSVFGRLDWQLSDDNVLGVSVFYGNEKLTDADFTAPVPSLGSSLTQSAFVGDAVLSSALSPKLASELRAGIQVNSRTDTAGGPIGTWVVAPGAGFGVDGNVVGQYQRTAILLRESMEWRPGPHRFKFGAEITAPSYQVTSAYNQEGAYVFGGAAQFAARQGAFVQAVGTVPTAQFSAPQFGGFLQDSWAAAPGFDLLFGIRYDVEKVPQSDILVNTAWLAATGLRNSSVPTRLNKFSPRFGATWDVGRRHQWLVSVEGGSFSSVMDPNVLAALLTEDGSVTVRRGLGALGSWPGAPDSAHAPVIGPRLTLFGPQFEAPRTRRFGTGITGMLGGGFELHVDGVYRHTDFLERRTDLNLAAGPSGTDQYGRPLYGTLVQEGALLAVQPGSNRRFAGFDLVSALNPDGYSDYYGVTFDLERTVAPGLKVIASYTYSQTTDNWLSGNNAPGDPSAQLSPFPAGLNGQDWSKSTSDFDVPHRIVLAADVTLRRLHGAHLAVVYRYRSGYPFTPGFRPGVDANGDGASNDPAFVDDTVRGMTGVLAKWSCLKGQVGQFAARNSCRAPGVNALDLRLEIPTVTLGGYPLTITADVLNLLESDVGVIDQALYLVDPTRATATVGSVTHVPLVANPSFGNVLLRDSSGRYLRVGLRVNW